MRPLVGNIADISASLQLAARISGAFVMIPRRTVIDVRATLSVWRDVRPIDAHEALYTDSAI